MQKEKHTIYLRQNGNGNGHYGWQYSRMPPEHPEAIWWGDYKTEGVARAQAQRAISFPLGAKNSKRVPASFEFVVVRVTTSAM